MCLYAVCVFVVLSPTHFPVCVSPVHILSVYCLCLFYDSFVNMVGRESLPALFMIHHHDMFIRIRFSGYLIFNCIRAMKFHLSDLCGKIDGLDFSGDV